MNNKRIVLVVAASLVVVSVVIVLFSTGDRTAGTHIGAVLPLTGDIASYGTRAQNGIQLALDEINHADPKKPKILVDFQDGKGSAQESVTIMKKFCSVNRYPIVIGAAASSVSMAMAPIANQHKVVQISPISSSPELTEKGGDYFFRVCPSDAFQAVILAEWMREQNIKSIGILFVNNSWGASLKDRFVEAFKAKRGIIKTVESCNEGDRDFRTQLAKIIASKPDAFYCPTYGKEGGLILKQVKEFGFDKPIFGSDVWSSPELLTSAGNAAEGVFLVKPAPPKGIAYGEFRSKYLTKYNEEPDVYAAYAYDIMIILAKAFDSEKVTGSEIRDYLLTMSSYDGVTGVTKFDTNGDCNTKSFIRQHIVGANYVEVE